MSWLIAHGHAEKSQGPDASEQALGSMFLQDIGSIKIVVEGATASEDIIITFPASTVEDAVRRRIRAGRPA